MTHSSLLLTAVVLVAASSAVCQTAPDSSSDEDWLAAFNEGAIAQDEGSITCRETPLGQECSFSIPKGSLGWYLAEAEWRLAIEDYEAALVSLDSALISEPRSTYARALRGYSLAKTGEVSTAMLTFRDALAIDAQDPEIYYQRASVKLGLGDAPGAIRDLRRALDLDPSVWRTPRLLGLAHLRAGDYEAALSAAEATVSTAGDDCAECYSFAGLLRVMVNDDVDGGCRYFSRSGELGHALAYDHIQDYCTR